LITLRDKKTPITETIKTTLGREIPIKIETENGILTKVEYDETKLTATEKTNITNIIMAENPNLKAES